MEKALRVLFVVLLAAGLCSAAYNESWRDPHVKVTPENFAGSFVNTTGYMLSGGGQVLRQNIGFYLFIAIFFVIIVLFLGLALLIWRKHKE